MSCASLWFKASSPKQNAKYQLEKFAHLLKWKNYKEHILDAGCGEGSVTKKILYPVVKDHVKKILSVDKSEVMINFAKEHNKVEDIDYQIMDVMDQAQVKKAQDQFDHIFAVHLAQWIPDTRTLLTGFHKMLKPHGQIFVASFVDAFLYRVFRKQFQDGKWSKYLPSVPVFADYTSNPTQYIQHLLNDIGFRLDAHNHEVKMLYEERFTDFLRSVLLMYVHFSRIPPELQEEYFQDCLRLCYESCNYLGAPDKYEMYYEPFTFIATKIK